MAEKRRRPRKEEIKETAREAVREGKEVREKIHKLTVSALAEGKFEIREVRGVIQAVLEGATEGVDEYGERASEALQEAAKGVEDALTKVAEASRMALEEAAKKSESFAEEEARALLEFTRRLEETFVDTLSEIASRSSAQVKSALSDIADRARRSGTTIGKAVADLLEKVPPKLEEVAVWGVKASFEVARKTGVQLAELASGFLSGLAEVLEKQVERLGAEEREERSKRKKS